MTPILPTTYDALWAVLAVPFVLFMLALPVIVIVILIRVNQIKKYLEQLVADRKTNS